MPNPDRISLAYLGKNLRLLRTSRDISQSDMAESLGLTRSSYAQYELGNRMPDARILYEIARFFSFDMELLFETDQAKFLSEISCAVIHSDKDEKLLENYRLMSPFSKGRLLEFSEKLVESDMIRERNLRELQKRCRAE